ncbi:lysogeny maintenance protein PflM [Pseudomonas aeruginosa]|uniref:lysogeny maintenance protein PflM n=1 Tax=Pseudomonas aeruginosa TaxID=287 RepID=UPI003D2B21D3
MPAPWAALSGRWPLALPSPFLLRETRPVPASAKVLALVYDSGKPTPGVRLHKPFVLE